MPCLRQYLKRYTPLMRKPFIFLLAISFTLSFCRIKESKSADNDTEPDLYSVSEDDAEMNTAIQTAKQTLNTFDSALQSKNSSYYFFALKARFDVEQGTEHIWLADVIRKDGQYKGVIDNIPKSIRGIRSGDTITLDTGRVTDWMFLENGKLRGGYTIRVVRRHMTQKEREAFDNENGITVEN
jgi:uncharacterized protein YegJ (DUF2314 family)